MFHQLCKLSLSLTEQSSYTNTNIIRVQRILHIEQNTSTYSAHLYESITRTG